MELQNPIDRFKSLAVASVPGLLVLCDLADAKRRNIHLGFKVVDSDIEEFDQLLKNWASPAGLVTRIKGNTWLGIGDLDSLPALTATLSAYRQQQVINIGWQSIGKKDGAKKIAERIKSTTITRAVRCLHSPVTNHQDLHLLVDELLKHCQGFAPDKPVKLSELNQANRTKWTSVTAYPPESPFCPFCEGDDFDWEDGDDSVYSGSGTCKNCGAEIDIRGVEKVGKPD